MITSSDALAIALQHHQAGRLSEAEQMYRQILRQQPDHVDALHLLGLIAYQSGQREAAITLYRQALGLNSSLSQVHSNLGIALKQQGQLEEAVHHYYQAIALQPNSAQYHYNLGIAFQEQGQLEEAVYYYHKATALQSDYAEAYNNLGYVLNQLGQIEESLASYDAAVNLKPDFAIAHRNRAEALLLIGDFNRGFTEYEWRWQLYDPRKLPTLHTPFWDGSHLAGKTILLYSEQGFGDTIQFIRYATLVRKLGGRVIAACPPSLVRLLKTISDIEQVVALDEEVDEKMPEFDVHAPLMSLPRMLGTTLETIPAQIPYLTPPKSHKHKLEAPTGTRLKVGIVWAGNYDNRHNIRRSCGLQPFLPLLKILGVAFYSLQVGPQSQDLAKLPATIRVQDLSGQVSDFADTAAFVMQLDLVITIDTSVAHLAGALGKSTWLLLPFAPDWRWMLKREDSPWYPSMRLFRQESLGNWSAVFAQVAEVLQALTLQITN